MAHLITLNKLTTQQPPLARKFDKSSLRQWHALCFIASHQTFTPQQRKTTMTFALNTTLAHLLNDEAGFIVSAELVLISTIAVLGLVVGLSEVALNVNNELEDVGSAFASVRQTYKIHCTGGHGAERAGSYFYDHDDYCDGQFDIY
jgi:NAD/NADP transhydrogenase alpha subunit